MSFDINFKCLAYTQTLLGFTANHVYGMCKPSHLTLDGKVKELRQELSRAIGQVPQDLSPECESAADTTMGATTDTTRITTTLNV